MSLTKAEWGHLIERYFMSFSRFYYNKMHKLQERVCKLQEQVSRGSTMLDFPRFHSVDGRWRSSMCMRR